jgi:plasmid stabilization system protein ParE
MAYRIFWTPIAVQDLHDICDFISRDNPVAAQRMGEELIKQSERWQSSHRVVVWYPRKKIR